MELGLDPLDIPGLWVIYMAQILSLLILGFKIAQASWEDLQVSLCGGSSFLLGHHIPSVKAKRIISTLRYAEMCFTLQAMVGSINYEVVTACLAWLTYNRRHNSSVMGG